MDEWVVKVKHYRGGESVLHSRLTKEQAGTVRDELNSRYQTDNHYIERFDPEKAKEFGLSAGQVKEFVLRLK